MAAVGTAPRRAAAGRRDRSRAANRRRRRARWGGGAVRQIETYGRSRTSAATAAYLVARVDDGRGGRRPWLSARNLERTARAGTNAPAPPSPPTWSLIRAW